MSNCSCNSMDSSTDPLSRKLLVQVQPGAQSQATSHSASPDRETWRGKADALLDRLQLHSICGKVVRQKLRVRHRQCQINNTVLD